MKPKKTNHSQDRLFDQRLSKQLNPNHELCIFSMLLDWHALEDKFGLLFVQDEGKPAKPVRLVLGIMLLQQMYGLSDEAVVVRWVENPYWQLFCGFDYLQWKFPIHPTTLVGWRKRIGTEGIETVIEKLIDTALRVGMVKPSSLTKVIADTTVMPKGITFPTDAKLYQKGIEELVKFAESNQIMLRQTYKRLSKKAVRLSSRLFHSRKYKQARKEVKRVKTYLGRVFRDIFRKIENNKELEQRAAPVLTVIGRLLMQEKDDANKIYSLHEPEVECISKGKANKKYEFGCKASLVLTHKEGLLLSIQALHGKPYDGHTLKAALEGAKMNSGKEVEVVYVDRGYRGHGVKSCKVVMSQSKKGLHWRAWKDVCRRQSIEPHIGHMKSEGKLGLNFLKGKLGDKLNAALCGIGHNMRLIINYIKKQDPLCYNLS